MNENQWLCENYAAQLLCIVLEELHLERCHLSGVAVVVKRAKYLRPKVVCQKHLERLVVFFQIEV